MSWHPPDRDSIKPLQCFSPTITASLSVFSFNHTIAENRLLLSSKSSELNCIVGGTNFPMFELASTIQDKWAIVGHQRVHASPIIANAPSIEPQITEESLGFRFFTRCKMPKPAKTDRKMPVRTIHLSQQVGMYSGNNSHERDPIRETINGIFSRLSFITKKPIAPGTAINPFKTD